MTTVLDVAKLARVSSATVSRVLNGHASVNAEARERVLDAALKLGFRPNRMAQGLRRGRGNAIALLVGDIEQNLYSALTKHVQAAVAAIGLDVLLYNLDHSAARLDSFLSLAPALGLRGIVIATSDRIGPKFDATLAALQAGGLTVLSMVQRMDHRGVPSIVHEEFAATRQAVRYLIDAGRAPVVYVGRMGSSDLGTERYAGYRAALADAGEPLRRELTQEARYSYVAGYEAAQRLLDAGVAFRAVQAGSDVIALGVLAGLADRGVRVPDDVAVIGFGNADWTGFVRPSLTTLSVHHEAAAMAVRSAFEAAEAGRDIPPLVTINRSLIPRESA
ncbi:LacI family DNA-binding transcriptional regulator [Falsiroseomonas sp. HW251]|uniref:LacI family DNA-binding transcriptional regulator n=1 Tax=Falsiroseomonas sp. HW251 TaxID=3390998 RepID=UPI003D31BEB5